LEKGVRFKIELEFDVLSEGPQSQVVASCPQLNLQTSGASVREAAALMGEAMVFFFDNAEERCELEPVLQALADGTAPPPRGLI